MINEELIFKIKDEMDLCDREITKVKTQVERMEEKIICLQDRRIILRDLLQTAEKEAETNMNPPVNPGDTVWIIFSNTTIDREEIAQIRSLGDISQILFKSGRSYSICTLNEEWSDHFGVSIFLTREEAEKALKERADNVT